MNVVALTSSSSEPITVMPGLFPALLSLYFLAAIIVAGVALVMAINAILLSARGLIEDVNALPAMISARVYGVPGQLFLQHHVNTGGFEPSSAGNPAPVAAVSWMRNESMAGHLLLCREADGSLYCSMQNENFEDFKRSIASQVTVIQVSAPTVARTNH